MAKILVAFPTKGDIDGEAAVAAANLDPCGHQLDYARADGRGVYGAAQARNCCARKAMNDGYDYVLMIDSDTIVPEDALKNLLDPPVDIALGVYRYKNETGDAPFFHTRKVAGSDKWVYNDMPNKRFTVKAAGLGCALIKVDVFRNMDLPLFHWDERPSGHHTGEDIWFCEHAKEKGYEIWADGRVRCGHAGRKVYR